MRRVVSTLLLLCCPVALAIGGDPWQSNSSSYRRPPSAAGRNSYGRTKRSHSARSAFVHQNPCPATGKTAGSCPGYVVVHTVPLRCGGADDPSNMQWQTKAAAKAKARAERHCKV